MGTVPISLLQKEHYIILIFKYRVSDQTSINECDWSNLQTSIFLSGSCDTQGTKKLKLYSVFVSCSNGKSEPKGTISKKGHLFDFLCNLWYNVVDKFFKVLIKYFKRDNTLYLLYRRIKI